MPPPMVCVLRQGLIMLAQALSLECWAYIGLSVLPPDLMCFSFSFSGIHSFIHSFILADFVSQVFLNSLCSWGCFDPPALPSKNGITGLYHHALLWTRFLIMGSGILWDLGFWKSLFFLWFFKKMYTVFACTYIYTSFVLGSPGIRIACGYELPYGWVDGNRIWVLCKEPQILFTEVSSSVLKRLV